MVRDRPREFHLDPIGDDVHEVHYSEEEDDRESLSDAQLPDFNDVSTEFQRNFNGVETAFQPRRNDVETTLKPRRNDDSKPLQTEKATITKLIRSYQKGDQVMAELDNYSEIRDKFLEKFFIEKVTGGLKLESLAPTKNKELAEYCAENFGISQEMTARLVLETRIYKETQSKMKLRKILFVTLCVLFTICIVKTNTTISEAQNEPETKETITLHNPEEFLHHWQKSYGVQFTPWRIENVILKKLSSLTPTEADKFLKEQRAEQEKSYKK